jgi:hypothetical protein
MMNFNNICDNCLLLECDYYKCPLTLAQGILTKEDTKDFEEIFTELE